MFGSLGPIHRTISISSQGHPIASAPASRRPSSRHPSGVSTAIRTPAIPSRSLSRAPSLKPTFEQQEKFELSTVIDQELDEQLEDLPESDLQEIDAGSRSTSTTKRRKRGARKGKGGSAISPLDDTLATLANASQTLARELSKASKLSSRRYAKCLFSLRYCFSDFPYSTAIFRNHLHQLLPRSPRNRLSGNLVSARCPPTAWKRVLHLQQNCQRQTGCLPQRAT